LQPQRTSGSTNLWSADAENTEERRKKGENSRISPFFSAISAASAVNFLHIIMTARFSWAEKMNAAALRHG
jgi:hypothetical protein